MGSVLITMPNMNDAAKLAEMLRSQGLPHEIEICQTASEMLRISNERDFGVMICTKNLKDMSFVELSDYMPEYFGMILLTKDMMMDTYSDRIVKIIMPFKVRELMSTVDMMTSMFIRKIKKKNPVPHKRSAEEEKLISEAKELLMERNGMTEPEAFRYMQKNSMDMGRSLVETAHMILILSN